MTTTLFVPIEDLIGQAWPKDLFDPPKVDTLDGIWMEPLDVERDPHLKVQTAILFETELAIGIPGLDAVQLLLAPNGSNTAFAFQIDTEPVPEFSIIDIPIALRLDTQLFKPAQRVTPSVPDKPSSFKPDTSTKYTDIPLGKITLSIDLDGNIDLEGTINISLPPMFIGETGVVVEASNIGIYLHNDKPPDGKTVGWRGLYISKAKVYLPGELGGIVGNLALTNAYIGNGGFTGTISDIWTTPLEAELFGLKFFLKEVSIEFKQNALTSSRIAGSITLPFFEEKIDVEIAVNLSGAFTVRLGSKGIAPLEKENVFRFTVDSLGFEVIDGTFTAKLSGELKPLIGNLDWPSFKVNELSIDSEGNVHLDGGWLNLPNQYKLGFHGFQLEITKLGFGKTDDGGNWIGFSGGVKLVEGLPMGASVEGLRLIWYDDSSKDPYMTFSGVGVEFEVPNVLHFKGAVSYEKFKTNGKTDHRFAGEIKLNLIALNLEIDCQLVIGHINGDAYLAIYLEVDLPAGIPLWSTGLALYGMGGLFARQYEPEKGKEQAWYGVDRSKSWYHEPPIGVTGLTKKWGPQSGSLALGAGITIGTVTDNGYTFSGKMLMVIVFPGPILMIEGKANILQRRSKLDDEPLFRALAVLDARAGTFLIGVDAQYKFAGGGELIEIGGSAEIFFNLNDASAWHLYLGQKEPREMRIRARIFKLFGSSSYFMLDANSLAFGSWVGYGNSWKFGPLSVTLEAWLEYNVGVSWNPPHLHGDIWLHGKGELKVFWFGFGLSLDAGIAADVFDPFHLLAKLSVGVNLSWPLPDFSVSIKLEWGPSPDRPPLPLPLKEIAVEHLKVTSSWPLTREQKLLLPNYNNNGVRKEPDISPNTIDLAPPPDKLPIVPMDCRPHITFSRPVHDDANVGLNPQPPQPAYERIGDPEKGEGPIQIRYGLKKITLDEYDPISKSWQKGKISTVFGSWAPVPAMPDRGGKAVAQTKLWLWSKTPYDYTRHTGRYWDEWFSDRFTSYPCIPIPADKEICYDFEAVDPLTSLTSAWAHTEQNKLIFQWLVPQTLNTLALPAPVAGRHHVVCFPTHVSLPDGTVKTNQISIILPQLAKEVKLIVRRTNGLPATDVTGYDANGTAVGNGTISGSSFINVSGRATKQLISRVVIQNKDTSFCLVAVCITVGLNYDEISRRLEMATHLQKETARWEQTDVVLEPHTIYRLKIETTIKAQGEGELKGYSPEPDQTEFAYFCTGGPPGLTKDEHGLNDLNLYVDQTIPSSIPAPGEQPVLPRPVYRSYDVGVKFNENYVDLMYRIANRDLGLYLYDSNNRPVRDAQGRLIVLNNRWGKTETHEFTNSDVRWILDINTSNCVSALNLKAIPHNKTLIAADEGQTLDPDTVYEAQLVPVLLHENFSGFAAGTIIKGSGSKLDGWKVYDAGKKSGPSHWEIGQAGQSSNASHYIVQKSNIWGGNIDGTDAVKPGTYLLRESNPKLGDKHPDQPANWTDYRMSVYLRSADDDVIGVVFRYKNPQKYFFFAMDRERKYRRLVRVVKGKYKILAEDEFVYVKNRDYLVTIEAIGTSIRINQDGAPVFDVTDGSITSGTIGLYCWGNMGACFSDLRVDDFRQKHPVAYRFKFTTSCFTNFFHHMHSFQDEIWKQPLPAGANISNLLTAATALNTKPSEQEARTYQKLLTAVTGQTIRQDPKALQISRIQADDQTLLLLVESPEPIDWNRTSLKVLHAGRSLPKPTLPGEVKLTDVTFGSTQPEQESVSLLLRDKTDLSNHRIEYRKLPGAVVEPSGDPMMFADDFSKVESGLLFHEKFGPNALDHYTIVDEGTEYGPSNWMYERQSKGGTYIGAIIQTSDIYAGSIGGDVRELPGTMAITGSRKWTNMRIPVTLRSEDDGAIGIVFRYQNQKNFYRFLMGNFSIGDRFSLGKKVNGKYEEIWRQEQPFIQGRSYQLVLEVYGNRLLGYLDNSLLFSLKDEDIASGQVGLYSWQNSGAIFEALEVERLESDPVLWQPSLTDMSELDVTDEVNAVHGPSKWAANNGVLTQSSNIQLPDTTPQSILYRPGTYALGGSDDWEDMEISVRLRSDDNGAIGVLFRVSPHFNASGDQTGHNYYRFSMDRQGGYYRLIKKVGDTVSQLWWDNTKYSIGQTYELTIRAVGNELCAYLDGIRIFNVYDSDLSYGQVGFYCWANTGVRFEQMVVTDRTRFTGRWVIKDEGSVKAPSIWQIKSGALLQLSGISGGSAPQCLGTYALAGKSSWTDYRLIARLRSDGNGAVGLIFRNSNPDNYYRLSLDAHSSCRLVKRENGISTTLKNKARSYVPGETFTLVVDAVGPRLRCYLGDERLFDEIDSSHSAGKVGLYCWDNNAMRIEQVEVRCPPLEASALLCDRFPAGTKSGWTIIDEGTSYDPSNWGIHMGTLRQTTDIFSPPIDRDTLSKLGTQAVAGDITWSDIILSARVRSLDDDALGLLFRYSDADHYYRFSMDSQRGYRRLVKKVGPENNFIQLWEDDFAFVVGRSYEITIVATGSTLRGYWDGVPMFMVDDGDLLSGRIGLYCWGNHDARFSQVRVWPADLAFDNWLLEDQFEVLVDDRWNIVDEGNQQGASNWEVVDGELRQTSNVYGGSTDVSVPDKPGTYALAGKLKWTDYRLSARLISDDDDAIGVIFRYKDQNNYYRFSMDRERHYWRLIKKVNGNVAILKENDSFRYALNLDYILTVDCVGERLTVYLNGAQLCDVQDDALGEGCIGMYCWANSGARFTDVRVAAPVWIPYYRFGREEKMPAGTRVQVYAGNKQQAPEHKPGVINRFKTSLDVSGRLNFLPEGVDLRLRAPKETKGHSRYFLPDDAYMQVNNAKVLRKADGTGCFLVVPFTSISDSQYRLNMTYRRDNQSKDPGSMVLKQAGNSESEIVSIDIPW